MPPRVHLSDHAVLRYLERILEVDVEGIKAKLAGEIAAAAVAGARKYTIGGATFVFDRQPSGDLCVVTVLTEKMRRGNRSSRRRSK
jgi:hypothetical protein